MSEVRVTWEFKCVICGITVVEKFAAEPWSDPVIGPPAGWHSRCSMEGQDKNEVGLVCRECASYKRLLKEERKDE